MNVEIAVKTCAKCFRPYDRHEFSKLKIDPERPDDGSLLRRLCHCGEPIALDTEGLDELDLRVSPLQHAARFPGSARGARAVSMFEAELAAMRLRQRVALAVALAVVAVLCGMLWL